MEFVARTTFRGRGIPDEAAFRDLEKPTVQNEAFDRIRGMLTRYSQVSVLKSCSLTIDTGKAFVGQQNQFANSLWELSLYFSDDPEVMAFLNKLIHALQEMNKYHTILLDQASRTVMKDLNNFTKTHIKRTKETRHYFERISSDLDIALNRNSQVPKSRSAEYEEVSNILSATRSCFRHTALDYIHALTMLQAHKRHEILGTLLSYMHACITYYHQGSDLAQDLDPFLKDLDENLVKMRSDSNKLEKEMENRHIYVNNQDLIPLPVPGNTKMEGYLFKRTSNAFKTWNRRWFCLKDHQLVYRKRTGDEGYTIMEEDLRLCTVKPVVDCDRRNCFEVLSPTKSHMLQADSVETYLAWVAAIQQAIGAAIQRGMSLGTSVNPHESQLCNSKGPARPLTKPKSSNVREAWIKSKYVDRKFVKALTEVVSTGHHASREQMRFRKWSVRKLRRRPRSCDKIDNSNVHKTSTLSSVKESHPSTSSDESKHTSIDSLNSVDKIKKTERNSVSSDDSANMDLKNNSSLYGKILNRSQNNLNDANKYVRNIVAHGEVVSDELLKGLDPIESERKLNTALTANINIVSVGESNDNSNKHIDNKVKHDNKNISGNKDFGTEMHCNAKKAESAVLMFGCDVPKPAIDDNLELSSDQDSTAGEDEELTDEEDIENLHPEMLLYKAAAAHNLPVMCAALAAGADKLWSNINDKSRNALHQAIISGSVMSCEYLLLNGARINCQDAEGKTPLHLATELGHTAQVCLLLKHRADQHIEDESGIKPLSIAVKEANADIVTLLRLGLLNEEMKDSEIGVTGDETFNDVVRDFSQLACSHPERLQRRTEAMNLPHTSD
ncbi:arf-GAP with coiled-coil, ANK repeat and PH domain-containing protein 2 isoform X3 [Pogonomyrmex barbatus]|uniref:Arf-GAP with coiled-coil, ANK repeat and PH domain-containing protein 2 isoform X3 n=1 Tax=Pogonomyrmex barbatus TaxID=144034 RepID=A0A6I9VM91_9HYME|nr:arf-GAP with coiled-coil, ANK repeat and PH domain-containing protein 2 isoform X3 [Pogonomyrmex barbatus]